jgi:tripartite-type tricarboxylate transporter receptor subunit TctC
MLKSRLVLLRKFCLCCIAMTATGARPAVAQVRTAADFPNRFVRIVAPQPAGSGVDTYTRAIAQKLSEAWGQQVVVDNRAGANGIIGVEQVAKAKPDGYTLLAAFTSVLAINPLVYKSLPYDTFRDLAPIMQTVTNTMALVVHPSLPARSVKELVALGKSRPGEFIYGSNGIGNLNHLAGELFALETRLKMLHVPYKGATPAITDLIGGQFTLMFGTAVGVAPHIQSGRLRLLATGGEKRAEAFSDTPTMVEAGLPNMVVTGWGGFLAPAGSPREIIEKIQRDVARQLQEPDLRERLRRDGSDPEVSTPEQFGAFIRAELEKWGRVVKQAGIYQSQ